MSAENFDKIEKIAEGVSTEGTQGTKEVGGPQGDVNKEGFDAAVQNQVSREEVASQQATSVNNKPLMDELRDLNQRTNTLTRASPTELSKQAKDLSEKIQTLKDKLASAPDLKLKGSIQNLLQNKLSHIDESLKIALSKAGVDSKAQPSVDAAEGGRKNPVEHFMNYLTHAQGELQSLGNEVASAGAEGKQFSPVAMLAIQMKVGVVQQEIELFTNLLNKALESTKTIMNVQV
jgi:hypothetical protein